MNNIKISEDSYLLASLIKACHLTNDQICTRLPIRRGMLRILLQQVETHFDESNQPFLKSLYLALFITTYFGLFRASEVTSGDHLVLAKDVHVGYNKNKFMFILHTTKTLWKNMTPQIVKISPTSSSCKKRDSNLPCPFHLLHDYLNRRGPFKSDLDPFFVFSDGSPVTPRQMNVCLKLVLHKAGLDQKLYSVHSLHAGRTCDLFKLGLSVETIKKIGRWRSNAVFRYLKL